MKKLLLLLLLPLAVLLATSILPANRAYAVNVINQACNDPNQAKRPAVCSDDNSNNPNNPLFGPGGLITNLIQILVIIIGIAAVFTIVIAGLRMIISAGDPNTITTSRNAIIYAVVGIVIAATAQALISFVLSKLGT